MTHKDFYITAFGVYTGSQDTGAVQNRQHTTLAVAYNKSHESEWY